VEVRVERDGDPRPWDVPAAGNGDALPDAVRDAARRAFGAGPAATDVADLVFDSVLDGGDPEPRTLRFAAPDSGRGVELTVTESGGSVTVTLAVSPPVPASVEVRSKGPTFTVPTGDNGVIRFDVPPGLVSVVITPVRSLWPRPLQTAWVRL
jgi:hypothetical protein